MSFFAITELRQVVKSLQPHERVLVWLLSLGLIVGAVGLVGNLQAQVSTEVPVHGGTYREGIVGFARYVNPVLANTNPDQSLSQLVYAGLMKRSVDGKLVPDLAVDMTAGSNQQTYTFRLNPNATFHDGHPVRAEDVVFTINAIKNPDNNSPKRAQWQNVSVTATDDTTVRFELPESYAGLPANATVGILPKHRWQNTGGRSFAFSQLNTDPIGAGPYQVKRVERNPNGVPTRYMLESFDAYTGSQPHIENLAIVSFPDRQSRRQAYENDQIDGMPNVDPAYAKQLQDGQSRVSTHQFNRVFSLFYNENQNEALVDSGVRKALSESISKNEIINSAVAGFGQAVDSPLPPSLSPQSTATSTQASPSELLDDAGWTLTDGKRQQDEQALTITLTTADIPSLRKTANIIANDWRNLGLTVQVNALPPAQLSQSVVRPRDFEALLFGQSVPSRRDLYSFWHSSRQEDPGLNFAQYTNSTADGSLEALRSATTTQEIDELTNNFLTEINQDEPAAFVFSPSFIYVLPETLGNVSIPPITQPADRFAIINDWYTDTEMLWNFFVEKDRKKK